VVVILVLLTIATFLIIDLHLRRVRAERGLSLVGHGSVAGRVGSQAPELAVVPGDTYLAPGHTWVRPQADGPMLLGAYRLPLCALGEVEHVQLERPGSEVRVGQPLATLGRGRRLVRLLSPVDGVVERVNRHVEREPRLLNDDPYRGGWLFIIRPRGLAAALRRMFVAEDATGWMRAEIARLRELIGQLGAPACAPAPTLLDGGVPVDGFAESLSDEQWVAVVETLFEPSATARPDS
jgi:glycine cleavage system H protein